MHAPPFITIVGAPPEVREISRNYHRFALFHCIQKWVSFNDPCGKSSRNWSSHLIIRPPKSSSHTWCLEPLKAFRLKKMEREFNSHPSSPGICLGINFLFIRTMQRKKQTKQTNVKLIRSVYFPLQESNLTNTERSFFSLWAWLRGRFGRWLCQTKKSEKLRIWKQQMCLPQFTKSNTKTFRPLELNWRWVAENLLKFHEFSVRPSRCKWPPVSKIDAKGPQRQVRSRIN